jgi:hypothetical protein
MDWTIMGAKLNLQVHLPSISLLPWKIDIRCDIRSRVNLPVGSKHSSLVIKGYSPLYTIENEMTIPGF